MPSKVLIVDDDPVIQLLLRVNFEMEGFEVSTADDGAQGLSRAKELLPDIILLDVMMPKLDGFQVLAHLKEDSTTAAIPVVLLSAKAGESDRLEGMRAGAKAYITKPFDALRLLGEVKGMLPAQPA